MFPMHAFEQLSKTDIAAAGGKGANLGELVRAGFPVPPGFVITTDSYRRFVEANQLQQRIDALAAAPDDDPAAVATASDRIRDLFAASPVPAELSEPIGAAYAMLSEKGQPAVAARSSATAEDLPGASFAGQQETVLNVQGEQALIEAVKQCWASLWTARAIAYRRRQGIAHDAVAMAVVVQQMVPAETAGILFTANPSTGARDELLVEASYGLGEAVVSGLVTPDTFVLARASLDLKDTRLGSKEQMVVGEPGADGAFTSARPVPAAQRGAAALAPPLLGELAALGLAVEEHFCGVPQDIEWAMADGQLWLLQARPITNLPPAPLRDVRWEPPVPGTVWMRRQIVEHMPEPLSPLFAELYLHDGLTQSLDAALEFMGGSFNFKEMLEEFLPHSFATTINGYAYTAASFDFNRRSFVTILRIYATMLPRLLRDGVSYWRDQGLPGYRAVIERWQHLTPASASDAELLRGVRELAMADAVYWFSAAIPLGLARITDSLLDGFLKWLAERGNPAVGPRPSSAPYLRGFPTTAMEAEARLEQIASGVRRSAALRDLVAATPAGRLLDRLAAHAEGRPVLGELRGYLDAYGHQIYNLDFAAPTQADDPLPVLLSLKAAAERPEREVRARQQELARERDELANETARSLGLLLRPLFRLLLGWAQRATPYRDEALFHVGAAWPTLRRLALELGGRLVHAGSLREADDVFFLRSAELAAARTTGAGRPGLALLARRRRELREARKRLSPPIAVPPGAALSLGPIKLTIFEPRLRDDNAGGPTLHGFAVSPGRAAAFASVIRSPAEFDRMEPDSILVCPTTTPAWTPLFSQARGLVTDIGGALAHGSIVAREYGIPAVMGTGGATQRIRSGQRIEVDGDGGTVTLLDEASVEASAEARAETTTLPGRRLALAALAAGAAGVVAWRGWRRLRRK